jgi:hypothetical protein
VKGNNTFGPDHERSQIILMLFSLFLEIGKVQATILQTLHRHNLQTGHNCGLYIKSVLAPTPNDTNVLLDSFHVRSQGSNKCHDDPPHVTGGMLE